MSRLRDSVCKVIADHYTGIPVDIAEVPKYFDRPQFFVSYVTETDNILNRSVYRAKPIIQIVYFGELRENNQAKVDDLYKIKEELKALFFLQLAVPILPKDGEYEKQRYAKIESYTSDLRISEGAVYTKMVLDFTEEIPRIDNHELIKDVDIDTKVSTKTK